MSSVDDTFQRCCSKEQSTAINRISRYMGYTGLTHAEIEARREYLKLIEYGQTVPTDVEVEDKSLFKRSKTKIIRTQKVTSTDLDNIVRHAPTTEDLSPYIEIYQDFVRQLGEIGSSASTEQNWHSVAPSAQSTFDQFLARNGDW